jgi:hypothetical protein
MQVRVLEATAGASGIHRHDQSDTQIFDKVIVPQSDCLERLRRILSAPKV